MQCITEHSSGIITRKYRDIIVERLDVGSNQSTSHVEQISFESVYAPTGDITTGLQGTARNLNSSAARRRIITWLWIG